MKTKKTEETKITENPEETKTTSTLTRLRSSHKFRLILIFILLVIVAILFFFFKKARLALAVIFITLLAAFGLEVTKNDWDLGKLLKTKSFQESKVSRDEKGNLLFDKFGNIMTDKAVGKKASDYNCDDFSSQPQAQQFFLKVGGLGNDLYRLDGDKDGIACEALPK